jgi:hypothetical protein
MVSSMISGGRRRVEELAERTKRLTQDLALLRQELEHDRTV